MDVTCKENISRCISRSDSIYPIAKAAVVADRSEIRTCGLQRGGSIMDDLVWII